MKYKVGDKVRIKSLDWYNENKDEDGIVELSTHIFTPGMSQFCGKVMTIEDVFEDIDDNGVYYMEEIDYDWTDEMIEGLVERNGKTYPYKIGDRVVLKGNNRCATITDLKYNSWGNLSYYIKIDNDKDISIDYPTDLLLPYDKKVEGLVEETKPKFKVGDRVIVRDMSGIWEITNLEDDILYTIKRENHTFTLTTYGSFLTLYEGISDKKEEMKSEDGLLDEYEELTDRAFKGGYEKCQSDILLNGYELPEGYIFKDQAGNEIHALKIVLEKANTLKIQSDNMETETHRGYYTTDEETTNKSKKVAWFTFGDNDFADKVELDLSNRELIQEDGKWFVVKKKKEYPKTYEECYKIMGVKLSDCYVQGYKSPLLEDLQELLICRDAYWKIAGEEMRLGKPWENSRYEVVYGICRDEGNIVKVDDYWGDTHIFEFPIREMRDAFKENFDKDLEICKELL